MNAANVSLQGASNTSVKNTKSVTSERKEEAISTGASGGNDIPYRMTVYVELKSFFEFNFASSIPNKLVKFKIFITVISSVDLQEFSMIVYSIKVIWKSIIFIHIIC